MSAVNSKRVDWLDMLRGFAMICVVLGHPADVPGDIEKWIYAFHMPLFFIISGATFRYERYTALKQCVLDQARKLLLPYVVMFIVCVPFYWLNRVFLPGDSPKKMSHLITGFFYANQGLETMSNGALWFLPTLFLTSVLFWWLSDLDHRGKVDIAASIGGLFLLGLFIATFTDFDAVWAISCVPLTVTFYYLGHVVMTAFHKHRVEIEQMSSSVMCFAAVLLLSVGTWAAFENRKISVLNNRYGTVILALIGIVAICGGLTLILMRAPHIKVLSFIGKNTLIYLGYHIPVMRFLENWSVTAQFCTNHPLWEGAAVVLILIPISYLISRYVPILGGKLPSRSSKTKENVTAAA
ncbi:MAG TPA: acyltransferase [Methanocorpusculum sp.]|nr:acyltransferase [Methanocorpusculum sp.]